jgi:hypothetical protein
MVTPVDVPVISRVSRVSRASRAGLRRVQADDRADRTVASQLDHRVDPGQRPAPGSETHQPRGRSTGAGLIRAHGTAHPMARGVGLRRGHTAVTPSCRASGSRARTPAARRSIGPLDDRPARLIAADPGRAGFDSADSRHLSLSAVLRRAGARWRHQGAGYRPESGRIRCIHRRERYQRGIGQVRDPISNVRSPWAISADFACPGSWHAPGPRTHARPGAAHALTPCGRTPRIKADSRA